MSSLSPQPLNKILINLPVEPEMLKNDPRQSEITIDTMQKHLPLHSDQPLSFNLALWLIRTCHLSVQTLCDNASIYRYIVTDQSGQELDFKKTIDLNLLPDIELYIFRNDKELNDTSMILQKIEDQKRFLTELQACALKQLPTETQKHDECGKVVAEVPGALPLSSKEQTAANSIIIDKQKLITIESKETNRKSGSKPLQEVLPQFTLAKDMKNKKAEFFISSQSSSSSNASREEDERKLKALQDQLLQKQAKMRGQQPVGILKKTSMIKTEPQKVGSSNKKRDVKAMTKAQPPSDTKLDSSNVFDSKKHLKSGTTQNPDYFTCPEVNELVIEKKGQKFKTLDEFNQFVNQLNGCQGSDDYYVNGNSQTTYIKIECKFTGCNYSQWYKFDKKSSEEAINMIWFRGINKNHSLNAHSKGVLRDQYKNTL